MSWSNVQSWIDSWSFTVTGAQRGRTSTAKHFKEASRENLPKSRGWWIEVKSMSASLIGSLQGRYRQHVALDLLLHYPVDVEPEPLRAAIVQDYEAITKYLGNPANWGSPTSTVVSLATAAPLFPADLEQVDKSLILVIHLTIQHEVSP